MGKSRNQVEKKYLFDEAHTVNYLVLYWPPKMKKLIYLTGIFLRKINSKISKFRESRHPKYASNKKIRAFYLVNFFMKFAKTQSVFNFMYV